MVVVIGDNNGDEDGGDDADDGDADSLRGGIRKEGRRASERKKSLSSIKQALPLFNARQLLTDSEHVGFNCEGELASVVATSDPIRVNRLLYREEQKKATTSEKGGLGERA